MSGTTKKAVVDISQTASTFQSSIVLEYDNKYIDVKSILGLYNSLLTTDTYALHIHGPDEEEAKKAVIDVFKTYGVNVVLAED